MNTYGVGIRVTFTENTERFPFFTIPAGTEGTVTYEDHGDMLVQIDGDVPGLTDEAGMSEWDGEFQWTPSNGDVGEPPFRPVDPMDAIRLRTFTLDGEPLEGGIVRFACDNELQEQDLLAIARLEVDETLEMGGGAGATFDLRRIA